MSDVTLVPNSFVLRNRYELIERLSRSADREEWAARDEYMGTFLLKAWPYSGEKPNDVLRALWDIELRHLFRLSSSPESEARLVVLKDAGVDLKSKCFVMVLAAPGVTKLDTLLKDRKHHEWLRDLRTQDIRVRVWKGLRSVALGLTQLHEQQMLHRALSAENIYVSLDTGPESMRLGGFEWTVRIGSAPAPPSTMAPPEVAHPDASRGVHTFESDWFSFGALLARILASAELSSWLTSEQKYETMMLKVEQAPLYEIEKEVIRRLLAHSPENRLSRGYEVITHIDEILSRLDRPARLLENSYLGLIVLVGPGQPLTRAILEQETTMNALNTEAQRKFIQDDLRCPTIVRRQGGSHEAYTLVGNRLAYYVVEYAEPDTQRSGQWSLAFCGGDAEVRYSAGTEDQRQLRYPPIRVFTLLALRKDASVVHQSSVSWRSYLPKVERYAAAQERQRRFYDFFRFTNQMELIFRDAELFRYQIVEQRSSEGFEEVLIEGVERQRRVPRFAAVEGGMAGFLRRNIAEKAEGALVYLGAEDGLYLSRKDRPEFWTVTTVDDVRDRVTLQRVGIGLPPCPSPGFLRTFDMFGQISLIRRRKRAIERLRNHSYLLQALQFPHFVYIDTGVIALPLEVDPNRVDAAKQEALHQIWRTRPIFSLQGPPGTGKTTLVANLIGQILEDDSVAQILVTAQAHAAVDVLREKVTQDIFEGVEEDKRPLSIRLPRSKNKLQDDDLDSVTNVTLRMLERAESQIKLDSPVSAQWHDVVHAAIVALRTSDNQGGARDLCELVRRAANITYSTTTAGNLEELADMTQSFDWSLIEEAGKAHGFDLVLPLQTGHRWLLIGDQDQLPPYRYNDFANGLRNLDEAVEALAALPERAGGLVDVEVVFNWKASSELEKQERRELWLRWLPLFRELYRTCYEATAGVNLPGGEPAPVLASMLWQQHRMHPTIAGLISSAYYEDKLKSETVRNGEPLARVVHPFVVPSAVQGKAILWLDVPWVSDGGSGEKGPNEGSGRYISPSEVVAITNFITMLQPRADFDHQLKLAVLSPYRLQVLELNKALEEIYSKPQPWLRPLPITQKYRASTVDSFQGNQADIVIVSLVRNNDREEGKGLGFLSQASRMNVLFSRAERLLVLVGSWRFFEFQTRSIPADRGQPLGHWRLALDYLRQSFETEQAAIVSRDDLLVGKL